jgi:hypothetical protein
LELVEKATERIKEVNPLHDEVTKRRTTPDQRVIGFVLHSEEIKVSVEPHNFTQDWALIELYDKKIDWPSFKGNKVFVGTPFSSTSSSSLVITFSSLSQVLADNCFSFLRRR